MPSAPLSSDIVLIGAGIMSATLATMLRELLPNARLVLIEALDDCAQESSRAWNNAGTGHAGNCELNYTPRREDGAIPIGKALDVNVGFELSRQLWAHWVTQGRIADPAAFIRPCPHVSLVWGAENVAFLKARFEALATHHCFEEMEYTEDPAVIAEWAPLTMAGRDPAVPVAATRVRSGSDVNFGALTRSLLESLAAPEAQDVGKFSAFYGHEVTALARDGSGLDQGPDQGPEQGWKVTARHRATGAEIVVRTRFVFVGAGGAALPLLQKSGIPEARDYAGFPVSGLWLQCTDPEVTRHHLAKVYGMAAVGAPPMSVPHLDTRVIDGQSCLLFGPYAGLTTKFVKSGRWTDYFRSLTLRNIGPALYAGMRNFGLVRYLAREVLQGEARRFRALQAFYPRARRSQWKMVVAGQRVQIIRPENGQPGVLKLGTEVVTSADRSIAAVLGASPGASVAAEIGLKIVTTCFPDHATPDALRALFPTHGTDLRTDARACRQSRRETARILGLYDGSMPEPG